MGNDIVRVGPFPDVQDAPVITIDIDDGRSPGLPIDIGILCHDTLTDGITHIEIIAIVARITKHDRFIVGESWALVREELILQALLAKALVAIDGHGLTGGLSRPCTSNTGFAELIEL